MTRSHSGDCPTWVCLRCDPSPWTAEMSAIFPHSLNSDLFYFFATRISDASSRIRLIGWTFSNLNKETSVSSMIMQIQFELRLRNDVHQFRKKMEWPSSHNPHHLMPEHNFFNPQSSETVNPSVWPNHLCLQCQNCRVTHWLLTFPLPPGKGRRCYVVSIVDQ